MNTNNSPAAVPAPNQPPPVPTPQPWMQAFASNLAARDIISTRDIERVALDCAKHAPSPAPQGVSTLREAMAKAWDEWCALEPSNHPARSKIGLLNLLVTAAAPFCPPTGTDADKLLEELRVSLMNALRTYSTADGDIISAAINLSKRVDVEIPALRAERDLARGEAKRFHDDFCRETLRTSGYIMLLREVLGWLPYAEQELADRSRVHDAHNVFDLRTRINAVFKQPS